MPKKTKNAPALTNDQATEILLGPPPPAAAPLTEREKDLRVRRDHLRLDLAAILAEIRRPALVVPGEDSDEYPFDLACPFCTSRDLQYEEDEPAIRTVYGIDTSGEIEIGSEVEHNYDGATDARLWCRDCAEECSLPDGFTVEWV